MLKQSLAGASLAAFSLISQPLHAAYCDSYNVGGYTALEGTTVCFIYDSSLVDPIFGTLQVSGDNIYATPTSFSALSTDGQGTVTTTGTGTIEVIAKSGYTLDGINVGEVGNYRMTSGTGNSVDADGYLRIFDVADPVPVFGTEEETTLNITGDLTLNDSNLHSWSGAGGFDLTTSLWQDVNHVGLTLQNTLTATTTFFGESAMIQKKAVGSEITVSVITSPIPLPAAVWLFGSGLLGLAVFARRKAS